MGRLSPRTRNAQVALYQDKEVDFLVATDAIGMGLNMDVDHVAFASLAKFDGHRPRRLTPAEMAQIAGRAGRGMRDGTFGTTGELPAAARRSGRGGRGAQLRAAGPALLAQQRRSISRSIDALLDSLTAPPPGPGLVRGNDASDLETLTALAREPEIRGSRRDGRGGRACCGRPARSRISASSPTTPIPGFAPGCSATSRAKGGCRPTGWRGQIAALARTEGDIDTLMQRLVRRPRLVLHRRPRRLGGRRGALAGARPRGRGPAVRRAARAADRPLRRPPRGAC